jgi:DNA-binding Xre family transcriptional regulator
MSKKIENFLIETFIKKKWWINILVGIVGAVSMPELLPLKVENIIKFELIHSHLVNQFCWGFFLLFATEFVKKVFDVPKQVENSLEGLRKAYYLGFSSLLSDKIRDNLEKLENLFKESTRLDLKGILLDFAVNSLSSIGENGFVMVDATVSDYVKYIREVVGKSNQIAMTCVVRPYWFVVDEIQGVTLPPYKKSKYEFGKGEHLKYFGKVEAKRYLVVDEHMIAEMLLTAYIDKYIFEKYCPSNCPICKSFQNSTTLQFFKDKPSNCPICKSFNECYIHKDRIKCYIHGARIESNNIDDIPEIFWFKKEVNENMKVTLYYTLIRHIRRKVHEELDDRVYISNHQTHTSNHQSGIEIRFEFTNLEKGILRIRWGDRAVPLEQIDKDKFGKRVNPITGKDDPDHGHTFYDTFEKVLKGDIMKEINRYLKLLEGEVKKYFNANNVQNIRGMSSDEIKVLLANGNDDFKKIILEAIEELCSDLGKISLSDINKNLVNFYKQKGIAKVAYIVTYDPAKPEYPVRVARWKFNWDGDGKNEEGILNAPG